MEDEPPAAERVAGTGIGKAVVMVTIRDPGRAGGRPRQREAREFGTTRRSGQAARPGRSAGA